MLVNYFNTAAAPVTWTTKTISSSVASSEPPLIVAPTLEASATETATVMAPTETTSEPQGQATTTASESQPTDPATESTEWTQTVSPTLPVTEG